MDLPTQRARAIRFGELHQGPRILLLPNAWDAGSARIFENAGFPAIATTSAGVAFSHGLPDGERIGCATMLEAVAGIVSAVSVPVTADMLSGFGQTIEDIVETARAILRSGAIGMNIEDAAGDTTLADIALQAEKIQAIRGAVAAEGIPLVINARTDVYLREVGDPASRFEDAVRRANAYRKAGADCLFVPAVRDAETIRRLAGSIDGPLNVLAGPGVPPVAELERLGVRRVSVGSGPMRATLALTARIAQELLATGTFSAFDDAMPYADANRLFEEDR